MTFRTALTSAVALLGLIASADAQALDVIRRDDPAVPNCHLLNGVILRQSIDRYAEGGVTMPIWTVNPVISATPCRVRLGNEVIVIVRAENQAPGSRIWFLRGQDATEPAPHAAGTPLEPVR